MFTKGQIEFLENKFTETFQESIEIISIHAVEGAYDALIQYDGTNDRANRGHVYFSCFLLENKVEDLELQAITGKNYCYPPVIDTKPGRANGSRYQAKGHRKLL